MKKVRNLHEENQKILQEHSGLQQLITAKMRKIKLRRLIAFLSCFVLLFTLNQLKFKADTLQHIPTCNLEEHVHTASCYQDEELVCGLPEHTHTDACYQQRPVSPEPTVFDEFMDLNSQVVLASPSDDDVDVSVESVDEAVSETTIELGDDTYSETGDDYYDVPEVEMDLDDLYVEELPDDGTDDQPMDAEPTIDAEPTMDSEPTMDVEPAEEAEAAYTMHGDSVTFLSDVLNGVGLSLSGITYVGEIVEGGDAEAHLSIEAVEGVDGDYILRVVRDFDRITLEIMAESRNVEIALTNGVAAAIASDHQDAEEPEAAPEPEIEAAGPDDEGEVYVEAVTDGEESENTYEVTGTELEQTDVEEEQTEVGDLSASEIHEDDAEAQENPIEVAETLSEDAGDALGEGQSEDELADDAVNGEEASDEEASGEEVSDEEASDEEASDEEVTDEEVTDEEASDEEASDEEATDEEACPTRKRPTRKRPTKKHPTRKRPTMRTHPPPRAPLPPRP